MKLAFHYFYTSTSRKRSFSGMSIKKTGRKSQDVSSVDHFGTGTSGQLNKTAKAARSSKFGNNKQKVSQPTRLSPT